jgi:hypothetical protein
MTDDIMAALARIEEQNRQIIALLTGQPRTSLGGYTHPAIQGEPQVLTTMWNRCPNCGGLYAPLENHTCPKAL